MHLDERREQTARLVSEWSSNNKDRALR
jgi:hypothetical protein